MSCLVIGYDLSFLLGKYTVLLLLTHAYQFNRIQHILLAYIFATSLYRKDSGLVYHICKIGTYRSHSRKCYLVKIHCLVKQNILGMDLENLHTSLKIRLLNYDTAVKTTGTEQSFIKHLRSVGSCQQYDALLGIKAVHLGKKLVESLLTLIISAKLGITASSDSIYLIYEYDTGSIFLCFLEKVTDTGSTHTDIKLNEI